VAAPAGTAVEVVGSTWAAEVEEAALGIDLGMQVAVRTAAGSLVGTHGGRRVIGRSTVAPTFW